MSLATLSASRRVRPAGRGGMARGSAPRSWRGRLTGRVLGSTATLLQHLPDRQLHRVAHMLGAGLYRAQPARRELVRSNLRRVCQWLAGQGLGGARVARAATDERALERLVRASFGHYVRSYLEGAIAPVYAAAGQRGRIVADDPTLLDEMFGQAAVRADRTRDAAGGRAAGVGAVPVDARMSSGARPAIVLGLHFGAMEIAGIHAVTERGVQMTTPMETVADPDLQAYFVRTRGATGLRIIPTAGAGRELAACLAAGRPVGIVADRVVAGAGTRVELFGAPARLPLGPAVLALESGAPAWVVAARRTGWGEYRARIERLEMPADGSRRERLAAFLAAEARAFERAIADAPEQWWTLFFPIWEVSSGARAEARA